MMDCIKYTCKETDGLQMIVSKKTGHIITNVSEMLNSCIRCNKFKEECNLDKIEEMLNFLDDTEDDE